MDSLEHSVLLADVCAAGSTYAALELCSFVGDDIAVKVRENEYLEVLAALRVDELSCRDVNIPLISRNLGIILAYVLAKIEELTVGCLDDIRLGDN